MGVLEEALSLKNQGLSEEEIMSNLMEKGTSPKDIREALSQIKIKNVISDYESGEGKDLFTEQGEPSSQEQGQYLPQPGQAYASPQQEYPLQQEYYSQQQTYASPQQEYSPQEGYESYSPSTGGIDTSTIIEISEQVFSEKMKTLQKELDSFNEFKSLNQIRMENINDRLRKIETVFDKMQIAILEKIGSYGQNLEMIKKEIGMVQDSFSKVVNPLVDRAEKKQEEIKVRKQKKTSSKKKKISKK